MRVGQNESGSGVGLNRKIPSSSRWLRRSGRERETPVADSLADDGRAGGDGSCVSLSIEESDWTFSSFDQIDYIGCNGRWKNMFSNVENLEIIANFQEK